MNPWIFTCVGWTLALVPIAFVVGSFIRAGMGQREENEYRAALLARREPSFGFVEHVEPGIEWHD